MTSVSTGLQEAERGLLHVEEIRVDAPVGRTTWAGHSSHELRVGDDGRARVTGMSISGTMVTLRAAACATMRRTSSWV